MWKSIIFGVLAMIPLGFAQAQIPSTERAALIAIYNSTDGDNWQQNAEWNGPVGSECTWFRVTCAGGHVQYLDLHENNLNGTIPADLADLTNLEQLDLKGNPLLGGTIPPELGSLAMLEWLYLFNADLEGPIPPELGDLVSLERLLLHQNRLSGTIPSELGDLANLKWLLLDRNQLTGEIPIELGDLAALERLYLKENQLYGGIPSEFGDLTNLQQMYLNANELSGGIPPEFGFLSSLQELNLSSNRLSGSIPVQLGSLPSLLQLDLGDNWFSGSIPFELGSLPILRKLYLNDNELEGGIPPELGDLDFLRQLDLARNRLSGYIPLELGALTNMERLYLESNRLIGQIPLELEFTALANSDGLNIRWNGLYNTDPDLGVFLFSKQIGVDFWEESQTTAPTGLRALRTGDHTVELGWDAVGFLDTYEGGFEAYYVPTSGGTWTSAGRTSAKDVLAIPVTNLAPNVSYDFAVATYTKPHAENENEVLSEPGDVVTETTTDIGCAAPVISLAWTGAGAELTADQSGTYEWSTGEMTQTITVNPDEPEFFWVWVTVGPCTEADMILVDNGLFADGFESGDTTTWSSSSP